MGIDTRRSPFRATAKAVQPSQPRDGSQSHLLNPILY